MLEQVTWRHVGYAVLGAGVGGMLGVGLLLAILPALPAAEIIETVRNVELFDPSPRIRELEAEWVAAINEGAVEKVVAFFDSDARILPPTGAPVVGSGAIRRFTEELVARPGLRLETEVEVVRAATANDLAYSLGSYRMWWDGERGERQQVEGGFTVVWGKREGEWKVLSDAFNVLAPPPAKSGAGE